MNPHAMYIYLYIWHIDINTMYLKYIKSLHEKPMNDVFSRVLSQLTIFSLFISTTYLQHKKGRSRFVQFFLYINTNWIVIHEFTGYSRPRSFVTERNNLLWCYKLPRYLDNVLRHRLILDGLRHIIIILRQKRREISRT